MRKERRKVFLSSDESARLGPGFASSLIRFMRPATPVHRLSRRALERRQLWRRLAWAVSMVLLANAFVGGFLWQRIRSERPAPAQQPVFESASEAQQAVALRLLDDAVRARFEERPLATMNALAEARRADPGAPGLDVLAGEIALEKKDTDSLRRASASALRRGDNEASAKLLAALEVWLRRGELGVDRAGPQARQFLREAAETEPSSTAVYFFHGELSRLLGESGAAHENMLLALRRQVPWRSSASLRVKIQLAAAEASAGGDIIEVPAPDAQSAAALRWRDALRTGTGAEEALSAMITLTPSLQTTVLLDDPALQTENNAARIQALRRPLANAVMPGSSNDNCSP